MNPGEYVNPIPRKTWVSCAVVSGYTTARLLANERIKPALSGGATTASFVTLENVGNTAFSVKLRETDDRSISGTRFDLTANAIFLVPGGYTAATVNGLRDYLEVFCTGTTTGNLRMQIDSQRKWNELGFAKDDPFYPPQLFQAKEYPGPL